MVSETVWCSWCENVTAAGVHALPSTTTAPSLDIEWYSMGDHSEDSEEREYCHCEVHKVTNAIVAV